MSTPDVQPVSGEHGNSIYRVVHPASFRYYDQWLRSLKGYIGHGRLNAQDRKYPDGSAGFRVKYGDGTVESLTGTEENIAIVPFWMIEMAGYRYREVGMMALEAFDALTSPIEGRAIADRTIGLCHYPGGRSDHPSVNSEGKVMTGETLYARLFAKLLAASGCRELLTLDLHSNEADRYLDEAGVDHLNLTALPLLANHIKNGHTRLFRNMDLTNTKIACLDFGSLQRNIRLAGLLGLTPIHENLVICDKKRDSRGKTTMKMVYPQDPAVLKGVSVITADDIGDTLGSAGDLANLVEEHHAREFTLMLTHGTLSYPALDNLDKLRNHPGFRGMLVTDSLPIAMYDFEGEEGIEVVNMSTAGIFANILPAVVEYGTRTIAEDPTILRGTRYEHLLEFIMQPMEKHQVYEDFMMGKF